LVRNPSARYGADIEEIDRATRSQYVWGSGHPPARYITRQGLEPRRETSYRRCRERDAGCGERDHHEITTIAIIGSQWIVVRRPIRPERDVGAVRDTTSTAAQGTALRVARLAPPRRGQVPAFRGEIDPGAKPLEQPDVVVVHEATAVAMARGRLAEEPGVRGD
jgi:hypothetical protein